MTKETLKLTGQLHIVVRGKDGEIKDEREVKNLVVNAGLEFIASRMIGTADAVMSHMGLGSGTTAAAAGDTDLQTALGSRVGLASSAVDGADAKKVVYTANFPAGAGTGTVTEAGTFNAATAGIMLCRTTFAAVNKTADDALSITWTVTAGV